MQSSFLTDIVLVVDNNKPKENKQFGVWGLAFGVEVFPNFSL